MRSSRRILFVRIPRTTVVMLLAWSSLAWISSPAMGQTCTSFVNATDGDDSNPGSRILPWRSVEFAFDAAEDGDTVCIAAGEYFYGADADGIDLDTDGKSMDFVIGAFAGESEVRFSEKRLRIDTGDGVVRFLTGTANRLTLGPGIVNTDNPAEPGLLNFLHSLELYSGTLDVTAVDLTIEESVGSRSFVNPDNGDKSAPADAAVEIVDGRLEGTPVWTPVGRTYIYRVSGSPAEQPLVLPAELSGSVISFAQSGSIPFFQSLDADGTTLQFGHAGAVVFHADVLMNAATTRLEWTNEATGNVAMESDLRITSTTAADGELVLAGRGNVFIERILAAPSLSEPHTARLVHDGDAVLRVERFTGTSGTTGGPFALSLVNLNGSLELGTSAATMSPPGPIDNRDQLTLAGPVAPAAADPHSLVNTGQIDLRSFDLMIQEPGVSVLNSGTVLSSGTSGVKGRILVSADASFGGGGRVPSLFVSGGTLQLGNTGIDGALSVSGSGRIELNDEALLTVAGDLTLASQQAFATDRGTVVLSGPEQLLTVTSAGPFPRFRIPGSAVTVGPGSSVLPGITLESGGLSAQLASDLTVAGMLRVVGGAASVASSGNIRFMDGVSVESGVLLIESPRPVHWDGPFDTGNGTIEFVSPGLVASTGSTIGFEGASGIVLPSLILDASGATLQVGTSVHVESDLLLSSGVVLFQPGGELRVSGDLMRTSGRFEPTEGAILVLDGSQPQAVSGFSASVLPSLRLEGAGVSVSEPLTILGDVDIATGSTSVSGDALINVSGAFTQSEGVFRLDGTSSLFAAQGFSFEGGSFEAGSGSIRTTGDVNLSSAGLSARDADLILDGAGEISVAVQTDATFGSLSVRSETFSTFVGGGTLTLLGGLAVRRGGRLELSSTGILMSGSSSQPVVNNTGRIGGSGFVRLEGPAGTDPFLLSGGGMYGAISVELSDEASTVRLSDMDSLRVSGTIRFVSGGIDAAGRRVQLMTEDGAPGIVLNLEDALGSSGIPDGRGFTDTTGPLDLGTDGGAYDLGYVGSLTSPHLAGSEYVQGRVRNLNIEAPDAVNNPPVFGVSLGAAARISGQLTVASSSLLRLTGGPLTLAGPSVVHRVDGRIVGQYDTVLEGPGSMLLSTDSTAFVRFLGVAAPSPDDAILISGLPSASRIRIERGIVSIAGQRTLALTNSLAIVGGGLSLGTGMNIGSGAAAGVLDVQHANLLMDAGSFIEFPSGGTVSVDDSTTINLTPSARAVQDGRTGFLILRDESSLRAPAGIPRLMLDAVAGESDSDDIFLTGDLSITDALVHRNGDLRIGSNVLRLTDGFVEYDLDGDPFDGQSDEIVGDLADGGGKIEVTGGVDFRLGSDLLVQAATMIVDAPGQLVRLVSTSSEPRELQVSALPLELVSGTIDLGANDLRVTGSSANLLYLGDVDVIGSSGSPAPDHVHPLVAGNGGSFPLRDGDFGEIVVDGSGNATIAVTRPVVVPSLRVDGTVRLPVANEPLTISRRLVFGRDGATILAESTSDLKMAGGAALVRRGAGTLARAPAFDGQVDVFYDLDDGDLTGTDTGFLGSLDSGLELPATVGRLGILAGGESGGSLNRVSLSADVTVERMLVVYSGVLDRGGRSVVLSDDALLAIDQLDADAPAAFVGDTDWSAVGEIDFLAGAGIDRIDLDASLLPAAVAIDSLVVSLGRADGPAVSVRQRIPLSVNNLLVGSSGVRGTYRFDGVDILASGVVDIQNAAMLTSGLARLETGSDLSIGNGAELSGSVDAVVGGHLDLDGHFGGLSADLRGDLLQAGTVGAATRLSFRGSGQTWEIPPAAQTGSVEVDMTNPVVGLPVLRLVSATGDVGRTLTVNGTLHLTGGLLDTGDHRVRLGGPDDGYERNSDAGSAGNPPSHIVGTIVRHAEAETTDQIIYPTGDDSTYRPLTLLFASPLLSDTELGVRHESPPLASRNGLPVLSSDGVILQDAATFTWTITSSVNFAQSQPVTVTAELPEVVAGNAERHRLIRRTGSDFSAPWQAVGGNPVVSLVEDGLLVRSIEASGLLTPDGVTLGIGVPERLYSDEGLLQIVNMAPGAAREVLLSGERIIRSLAPGSAGGTIAVGLGGSGPEPIFLTIRDAVNATFRTDFETTIDADHVAIVGLMPGDNSNVDAHVFHMDRSSPPARDMVRLGFMHLDSTAAHLEIARGHPSAGPVFTADAPGAADGPVLLPAEPLLLIPVPGNGDGGGADFAVEEFRVDLTPVGGTSPLLVTADASLFGADIDSPFLALVAEDGTVRAGMIVTGIQPTPDEIPAGFRMDGNFPNPFNTHTTISFDLPDDAEVRLVVVDMLGRVVRRVDAGRFEAGADRRIRFGADGLASGVYVYRVEALSDRSRDVGSGTMVVVR